MITNKITNSIYDVGIFGAGVSGVAAAYNHARFSNIRKVLMLEKSPAIATINSHPLNNAQTSHDGSTETNYNLAHALKVQKAARYLRNYLKSKGCDPTLYRKALRMVLGVGSEEVAQLTERFDEFSPHYPDIFEAGKKWLEDHEPMIMEGRDPKESVSAIVSTEGYIVNYQRYAEELFKDTIRLNPDFDYAFNAPVQSIEFKDDHYEVKTPTNTFYCKVVLFEAGPYSLFFARELGYGLDYAILPVAGSFYSAGHLLKNKVYRVQIEGMPFAAIHGDPDILDMTDTRFGPTTKPLPLMERHHYRTFKDFMKLPLLSSMQGISALLKVVNENNLWRYAAKNFIFDMPIMGPAVFLKEVRPIIPTIKYSDLKLRRGAGGIRPQIVNLKTKKLEMGDSSIVGKNSIFNTTPSPGASVSMANGRRDAKKTVEFLGPGYYFDEEKFQKELGEIGQVPATP
ncbi:MAG: FAD-dependent oxidoreductase [Candidatus Taylorbacteria bacterium]|nr:FAD-dependent oxidoreductase [Candidatus Taylorbacteria bacterium]